MKKTITINGRDFKVTSKTINHIPALTGRSVFECYERPSLAKVHIYNDWLRWSIDSDIDDMTVASYNTNMFTLEFTARIDGVWYYGYITKTRQELTEIVNVL